MRSCLLTCALLLVLTAPSAEAQPDDPAPVDVQPRIYPFALWGPQGGFGFGAGLSVRNLGWSGSHALLTAKPAVHRGRYTLSLATNDPYTSPRYGLLDLRYERNGNQWYHGLGPGASKNHRVGLDLTTLAARLRLGAYPIGRALLIQPHVGVLHHQTHTVRNEDSGAIDALDPRSRTALQSASGALPRTEDRQTGLVVGLSVALDARDRRVVPRRGVHFQGTVRRYHELRSANLRFDRYNLDVSGYVPIADYHRLALRARAALTDPHGNTPLPFYLLPTLDAKTLPGYSRDRFFGPDLVQFRLAYHFPFAHVQDLFITEGWISLDAGSVYNDIFDEFELNMSFDDDIPSTQARYPLRSGASIGLRIAPLFKDDLFFDAALGFSPEGVSLISLGFTSDLRTLRLPPL